jgi:hypothetical protein
MEPPMPKEEPWAFELVYPPILWDVEDEALRLKYALSIELNSLPYLPFL